MDDQDEIVPNWKLVKQNGEVYDEGEDSHVSKKDIVSYAKNQGLKAIEIVAPGMERVLFEPKPTPPEKKSYWALKEKKGPGTDKYKEKKITKTEMEKIISKDWEISHPIWS